MVQVSKSHFNQQVKLRIYNLLGQEVTTIFTGKMVPGIYTFTWDGSNGLGHSAPSGVYFYRLLAGDRALSRSMVLRR